MVIGDEEVKKELMTLNIIWVAMLFSLAVYLFVGIQVVEDLPTSLGADIFAIVKSVVYVLAFVTLLITRYVTNLLLATKGNDRQTAPIRRPPSPHSAFRKYMTAMIVSWTMSESIGIYGLVLFFLGKDVTDLYLLISVSAAAICLYRPKKEDVIRLSQDSFETTAGHGS